MRYSYVLACAMMFIGARSRADVPEVIVMNGKWLAKAKAEAAAGDSPLGPALSHLVRQAEDSLKAGPFSVMDKTKVPPSGNKHDYMSFGPYWWPDPGKKWPRRQITERKPAGLLPFLGWGYLVYERPEYLKMMEKLPEKTRFNHRSRLLYPVPSSP